MGRWSAEGCRQIAQFEKLAFSGKTLECLGEETGRGAMVRKWSEELQGEGQEKGREAQDRLICSLNLSIMPLFCRDSLNPTQLPISRKPAGLSPVLGGVSGSEKELSLRRRWNSYLFPRYNFDCRIFTGTEIFRLMPILMLISCTPTLL